MAQSFYLQLEGNDLTPIGGLVLQHWNDQHVESMYDKHLLNAEIELIRERITPHSKILDAGCGEGEGSLAYSSVPGSKVHAVDFSETRLALAKQRLAGRENVLLRRLDLREGHI